MHNEMESLPGGDLTQPLITQRNEQTFYSARDGEEKYIFVMFSPNFAIFKRIHQIFSQQPEIVQNVEE